MTDEIGERNEIIAENENENENYDEESAEKIISELQEKIDNLEKTNKELKTKVDSFTKKQNLNSNILMGIATLGLKKKFGLNIPKLQNDSVKIAEIMKEKEDLQQINEKMLDMLTEKELENDELNEKFENYKLEVKKENEKNLEQIKTLEERIESMENSQNENNNVFKMLFEFEAQKSKLKEEIKDHEKNEYDLNQQIEEKESKIKKLNEEIQNLQFENLSLLNKSDMQNKINEEGFNDLQKLTDDNNKLKNELFSIKYDLKNKKK